MLRWVENGGMVYHDWAEKKELLPYVRFLKTDAAEAEILTGLTDRAEAARQLYQWGAKEILITHKMCIRDRSMERPPLLQLSRLQDAVVPFGYSLRARQR